jgi:heme a synthase
LSKPLRREARQRFNMESLLRMSLNKSSPWLHRFAVLTALATLVLLGAGGLVTSHGVGLAVPDWPNTYGYNMFFFPLSKWAGGIFYEHTHRLIAAGVGLLTSILAMWIWARETRSQTRFWGLALMAAVLVLMGARQMPIYYFLAVSAVVVMGISSYLTAKSLSVHWLGVAAFAAVVLQGVLGGLRVVWLKDEIGIFHAALAQVFFVLVCAISLMTSRWWQMRIPLTQPSPKGRGTEHPSQHAQPFSEVSALVQQPFEIRTLPPWFPRLVAASSLLILVQLILGATMRHQHAGLAIPDFPLAYGHLWPATDPASVAHYNQQRIEVTAVNSITSFQIVLQMIHRFIAIVILGAVAWCAWAARRGDSAQENPDRRPGGGLITKLTGFWLGLIFLQACLGATTVWSGKAADIATAHVLFGALSLGLGGMLSLVCYRESMALQTNEAVCMLDNSLSLLERWPARTEGRPPGRHGCRPLKHADLEVCAPSTRVGSAAAFESPGTNQPTLPPATPEFGTL